MTMSFVTKLYYWRRKRQRIRLDSFLYLSWFTATINTTVCSSSLFSTDLEGHQYELEPVNAMFFNCLYSSIHHIHKWRTSGKKLVPSHKSETSELAECLARLPPNVTFYGLLFKYNYLGCLQPLMFITDFLFAIRMDAYIFKETGWFCRFLKHQNWRATSRRWLQKSCKHVDPNFTSKPSSAHYNSVKQK